MNALWCIALLAAFLARPAESSQPLAAQLATRWVTVPSLTVAAGTSSSVTVAMPQVPITATNVRLQYAIDMTNADGSTKPAFVYAVENLSLSSACSGYDGSFGAVFSFSIGAQHVGSIGYHVGMCGGVPLTTFDGAVDFLAPNGSAYGGSGHTFGAGFPNYAAEVNVPSWAPTLRMNVSPWATFSTWHGDTNWISSGWIDGSNYSVRARIVYGVSP